MELPYFHGIVIRLGTLSKPWLLTSTPCIFLREKIGTLVA